MVNESRKPRTEAEHLDVSIVLGELSPVTSPVTPAESEPKVEVEAKPIAELKPLFHAYTSDDIDGLNWEWKWKVDATMPHPDAIEELSCFCPNPKCKLRIVPKENYRTVTKEYGEQHPGILASLPRSRYSSQVPFVEFACDKKCFHPITSESSLTIELNRIKRQIEQRAKKKT
jgi:hypothetical protein